VAACFAASRADVRTLALWGAYPSGRAFLREMAAFRAMSSANASGAKPRDYIQGDEEAIGFLLTESTGEALRGLDVLRLKGRIAEKAAVFRRNASFPVAPIAAHLRDAGAAVYLQPEATMDMAIFAAEPATVSRPFAEELGRWWVEACPAVRRARASLDRGSPLACMTQVSGGWGPPVREEVVHFGPGEQLFGIVTSPVAEAHAEKPAILLVNGGGNHRAGINRNHTEWARAWAALGLRVLRMDIRGLGDSPPAPYATGNVLYRVESHEDVSAGVDLLSARFGHEKVIAMGLCAGAYQAFHAALSDPRIDGLVMLNPLRFQRLEVLGPGERGELEYAPLAHYLRAAIDVGAWRRLASERRDPRVFARFVARRLYAKGASGVERFVSAARGQTPTMPRSWLAGALSALVDRGARVSIVFDDTNPLLPAFDESLAADRERLVKSGRLAVEIVSDADHIFSPLVAQEWLAEVLRRTLTTWAGLGDDACP
jgi:dienelactone hydrolase